MGEQRVWRARGWVCLLIIWWSVFASARIPAQVPIDAVADGATVSVNGLVICTLRTSTTDGLSPETRAQILVETLVALPYAGDVKVRKADNTFAIFAGGERVLTVTATEAKANRSSAQSLANLWAGRLKKSFSVPALSIATDTVRMPSPSNRTIPAKGYLWKTATVSSDNAEVVTPFLTESGVKLAANRPGTAIVTVSTPRLSQAIRVTVQPYAATLPQTLSVAVAGSPTMASTVGSVIDAAIQNQLQRVPNSQVRILSKAETIVPEAQSRSFPVRVRVWAEDAIQSEGVVNVIVRNIGVAFRRDKELWYCNEPENITSPGNLFAAALRADTPVRMLYHHINTATFAMYVRVQAVNESDQPARVLLIPGDSEPDKNPVRAGLKAADQYLRAWASGSGEIVTIPPRSSLPISFRRLGTNETMSGLCGLRLIDGPPSVLVRTDAWPPFNLERRWQDAIASTTPWRLVGANPINDLDLSNYQFSDLIFPDPQKSLAVEYRVGESWKFLRIGERPIAGADAKRVLSGNFGVTYAIKAMVSNPTQEPADLEVVFEASAGYSGALFYMNGAVMQTPLLQPKAEFRIERFRLGPGEERKVEFVTVPLSGSSYPAQITIRPFQELSSGVLGGG